MHRRWRHEAEDGGFAALSHPLCLRPQVITGKTVYRCLLVHTKDFCWWEGLFIIMERDL